MWKRRRPFLSILTACGVIGLASLAVIDQSVAAPLDRFDGDYRGQVTLSIPLCGSPRFEFGIAGGSLLLRPPAGDEALRVSALTGTVGGDGRVKGTIAIGQYVYPFEGVLRDGALEGTVVARKVICSGVLYRADLSWSVELIRSAAKPAPSEAARLDEAPATEAASDDQAADQATSAVTKSAREPAPLALPLGRFVALIIGNDKYRHLPALKTAARDAEAIAALLERRYGFKTTLLRNATRRDVLAALAALRARLSYEDNLLIYYAGHGQLDEVTERGYWLPVDAEEDNPANWISNADVTDMLKALPSRAVLVIADSCYSGTLTRSIAPVSARQSEHRAFLERVARKRARTVLASGGLEPVVDSGGGKHSVFAKALLDVLSENTAIIDAQSLFAPIRERVILNAEQTPEYSNVRLAGHEGGEFIFVPR